MKAGILVACVAIAVSATPTGPPPAPQPPNPPPQHGCGVVHPEGWDNDTTTNSLQMANYTRTWGVWVPPDYNSNNSKRWPVIFDYHGSGGTSWTQYMNSMYFNNTLGQQYLVIYPQGANKTWQGPSYADPHANDLLFTTELLQRVEETYCIDSSRVYASGKSNGGGFVDTLACSDNGDAFAAFGMASAALYTDITEWGCTKRRAILESHGNLDTTIPYEPTQDGRGGPLPSIPDWVSWWGHRNCGLCTTPNMTANLGGYNTTQYSCDGYDGVVNHYQIFDIGHCWPDAAENNNDALRNGSVEAHCLGVFQPLDFTQVVLEFFGRWNLDNAPSNRLVQGAWPWQGQKYSGEGTRG